MVELIYVNRVILFFYNLVPVKDNKLVVPLFFAIQVLKEIRMLLFLFTSWALLQNNHSGENYLIFINIFYCLCLVNKNCSRFPPLLMDAQVLHNVSLLTSLPCLSRLNVSASQCALYFARSNNACQTSDNYTIVCSDATKTC